MQYIFLLGKAKKPPIFNLKRRKAQCMNKEQLKKDVLDHTILNVKYHLTDKNRVIQRIFIDIRDFTDEIDIFNLLQYLNTKLQPMYKKQVSSTSYQKEYLASKKDHSICITQYASSQKGNIPYAYTYSIARLASLMNDLHNIEDIIESYIGFYLNDINY